MKILHIIILTIICSAFAGCEKDNFDAPKATLSGKVTYNGNAVGVRTNATQLELWQDGYALHSRMEHSRHPYLMVNTSWFVWQGHLGSLKPATPSLLM